jgi:hypothetical protein
MVWGDRPPVKNSNFDAAGLKRSINSEPRSDQADP